MTKKILITSALPYANGPLHFGHIAGAYLPGDCYARFQRLQHNDVLYICGSDEYGVAITLSAEMAGRTPREHVDLFHGVIKDFFDRLNLSFDHYSRTTWKGHAEPVQQYFLDLLENGYIEEKVTDQLFSEKDNRFMADRYVTGTCPKCGYDKARGDECPSCAASFDATDLLKPRSKVTNAPLIRKPTKHWFLLLDKFSERLLERLEKKNWKPNVVNFVKGYIKDLRPRAITRDSEWGIPVPLPNAEGKVLYVWFDAPIGYISATQEWAQQLGEPDKWKDYWLDQETKLVNFIGKDNIPFHAAIFPAMTLGQNLPLKTVDELPANEFYNLEGRQFSKSEGWYIDLENFFKHFSSDQIRYAIAANAPETSDSEFTWKDFQGRCNSELLGKYGNLANRVMVFAHRQCEGKVPAMNDLQKIDHDFLEEIRRVLGEIAEAYENFKLRKASQLIMELAQLGNTYFDGKQPWKEAKDPTTVPSMHNTIACCLECLKALALASAPIIPETAQKLWKMIGMETNLDEMNWNDVAEKPLATGQQLNEPKILFQKVEDELIQGEIDKLHEMAKKSKAEAAQVPLKPEISIEDVNKLDLRVVKVISAVEMPKSKKMLKLEVDLGLERRTVMAGVKGSYTPDQLIGKSFILVANLKPAKMMGVESQGMLLAAHGDPNLELVSVGEARPGSTVR